MPSTIRLQSFVVSPGRLPEVTGTVGLPPVSSLVCTSLTAFFVYCRRRRLHRCGHDGGVRGAQPSSVCLLGARSSSFVATVSRVAQESRDAHRLPMLPSSLWGMRTSGSSYAASLDSVCASTCVARYTPGAYWMVPRSPGGLPLSKRRCNIYLALSPRRGSRTMDNESATEHRLAREAAHGGWRCRAVAFRPGKCCPVSVGLLATQEALGMQWTQPMDMACA
ncbi:hypothetical protein LZ30DRAFT_419230 [Colletotrichum cereale]|nr:hypothetical protein LZ30DRAFT_419230 [Colletotrichum cereale]